MFLFMSATNTDRVCDGQHLPKLASYPAQGFRQAWVDLNLPGGPTGRDYATVA
jgi:hypothetical protein